MDKKCLFQDVSDSSGSNRSLVSVERGWVYIHGFVLSSYCYIVLFIMSFFFLLGGALLTAISYRPQEVGEQFGEWSYRLAKSRKTRVSGPAFLVLGLAMAIFSLVLCHLSRRVGALKNSVHSSNSVCPNQTDTEGPHLQRRRESTGVHVVEGVQVVVTEEEVQERPSFSNSCADVNHLLVSDIACFPKQNTPRSVRALEHEC